MTDALVLTGARLWGTAEAMPATVVIESGRISRVVSAATAAELPRSAEVIDLNGRWLMPGLLDRHVHFTLWSKHRARLDLAGTSSAAEAAARVTASLTAKPASFLVARGFQDALWPEAPTAELLDLAAQTAGEPDAAVVALSHDLHSVWLNTAAATALGTVPGLLREAAAFAAEIALEAMEARDHDAVEALVADAAAAAAARGVTGIMDLEMADNPAVWAARVGGGLTGLRVLAGVYPQHLEATIARGERTGTRLADAQGLVTVGPLKVFADGALNTRTAWCFDPYPGGEFGHSVHARGDLERTLVDAKERGFEVALHAIGDRAVAEALDAFEASGARGTVEHVQLIRDRDLPRFAELGVGAGIHPEHALDDRRVTDVMWQGRTQRAFPYGALARAGARLHLGSDAPVSPLDPWLGISAAVHRTRDDQPAWEPENALDIRTALAASWATPAVAPGAVADVIALDADPAACGPGELRGMQVALTITAGAVTHRAL